MAATQKSSKSCPDPTKCPGGLTPLELHAVAILGKKAKDWRDLVEPGFAQPIDVMLRITGTVDVAEGQTATSKSKPTAEDVLAVVMSTLGEKTRAKVCEALIAHRTDPAAVEITIEAAAIAKNLVETLTRSETQEKQGNVTGQLTVAKLPSRPR